MAKKELLANFPLKIFFRTFASHKIFCTLGKLTTAISSFRDPKDLDHKTAPSEVLTCRKTSLGKHSNKFFLFPLLFAAGCIFYFSFPVNFAYFSLAFFACFLSAILLIFFNRNSSSLIVSLTIAMFLAGSFYGLVYEKIFLNYQKITGKIYVVGEGKIVAVKKFHNPRNNLDGINLLIAPHFLKKPQNLETAKFFTQEAQNGAVANQLFQKSEPLNSKGSLDWKVAKSRDLQQGQILKEKKGEEAFEQEKSIHSKKEKRKEKQKKKAKSKKPKAKKSKRKCSKNHGMALESEGLKQDDLGGQKIINGEDLQQNQNLVSESSLNEAQATPQNQTANQFDKTIDKNGEQEGCVKKPRKKRKSKKREETTDTELTATEIRTELPDPTNAQNSAQTSTETLDSNQKILEEEKPKKRKKTKKPKKLAAAKIVGVSQKKFVNSFLNIDDLTELDREFLDLKNNPQAAEWEEVGDARFLKSPPPLISINLARNLTNESAQNPNWDCCVNQLFQNAGPLNDKDLLGWKVTKNGDLQQGHSTSEIVNCPNAADSGSCAVASDLEGEAKKILKKSKNFYAVNDIVSFYAVLKGPKYKEFGEDFDFERDAKLKGIGGFGFAIGVPQIISQNYENSLKLVLKFPDSFFRALRSKIEDRINEQLDGDAKGVALALLIGDQSQISKERMVDIRNSGLAHLLSISGFHLSLASAIFFIAIRYLLSRNEKLTLNFNLKKIAAIFAILASYFYLKIAGSPLPAQRAFVIVLVVMIGILIDRKFHNLRALAVAFLAIILMNPLALFSVSFQLSFSAVLVLASYYEILRPRLFTDATLRLERGFITGFTSKAKQYLTEIILLSFLIQLASLPFLMHNFRNLAPLGFAANMLAIPLTSFLIMPLGFLALFLMPIFGEILALKPMGMAISWLLKITEFIGEFEISKIRTPYLPAEGLIMANIGFLLFCLANSRKNKALGAIIFAVSFVSIGFESKPAIIFDSGQKFFAITERIEGKERLFFSKHLQISKKLQSWMAHFDEPEFLTIRKCAYKSSSELDEESISLPDYNLKLGKLEIKISSPAQSKSKRKKERENDDFEERPSGIRDLKEESDGDSENDAASEFMVKSKTESKSCLACNSSLCLLRYAPQTKQSQNLQEYRILIITKRNQISKLCSFSSIMKPDAVVNFSGRFQLPDCLKTSIIPLVIDNSDFLEGGNQQIFIELEGRLSSKSS